MAAETAALPQPPPGEGEFEDLKFVRYARNMILSPCSKTSFIEISNQVYFYKKYKTLGGKGRGPSRKPRYFSQD
jgi:hypothetical protein